MGKSRTTLSYCPNTYFITYINEEHVIWSVSCFGTELFIYHMGLFRSEGTIYRIFLTISSTQGVRNNSVVVSHLCHYFCQRDIWMYWNLRSASQLMVQSFVLHRLQHVHYTRFCISKCLFSFFKISSLDLCYLLTNCVNVNFNVTRECAGKEKWTLTFTKPQHSVSIY